jgi:hypothetical protein
MVAKNILCNCGCWDEGNRGREGKRDMENLTQ